MAEPALEKLLYDNSIYNAWQFVVNTAKTLHTADYCKKAIIALIRQMELEHSNWMKSLSHQLDEQKKKMV